MEQGVLHSGALLWAGDKEEFKNLMNIDAKVFNNILANKKLSNILKGLYT